MKFAASAIVLSALATSAFAATCTRTYTVVEDDYCDLISANHNVSTYQLAVVNKDTINDACSNLAIGQNLCLGFEGQDCQTTYVVQEGDYCDLISEKYAINNTILYTNNPQIDDNCYNLYIGEVLCVANSELVTPPPEGFILPGGTLDNDDTSADDSDATLSTSSTEEDDTSDPPAETTVAATTKITSSTAPAATQPPKNSSEDDGDDDEEEGDDDDCED